MVKLKSQTSPISVSGNQQDYLFIRNAKETKTSAVHSVLSESKYLKPEERLYIAYPSLQKTDQFTDIAADLYESMDAFARRYRQSSSKTVHER